MAGSMGGLLRTRGVSARLSRCRLDVHRASLGWPRVEQYGGIADQLRRASKSICALLVGGCRPAASVRMPSSAAIVSMAIGFGGRSEALVPLRRRSRLCRASSPAAAWQAELSEIARMLHGLRRTS